MTTRVIDTSVIMALLLGERGQDVAARLAPGAVLSSVSLAEVMAKCVEKAVPPQIARDFIRNSNMEVVAFDEELAVLSGDLFNVAAKGVLSLGDRACIATAIKMDAVAVTADRIWADLNLRCKIELIR